MRKLPIAASAGAGGLTIGGGLGYAVSKLTSTDLRQLLEKLMDGFFEFLRTQGTYTVFVLVVAGLFAVLFVWAVRKLIKGKQDEIDRLVAERDRFQKPFIQLWQSTKGKGKKK